MCFDIDFMGISGKKGGEKYIKREIKWKKENIVKEMEKKMG